MRLNNRKPSRVIGLLSVIYFVLLVLLYVAESMVAEKHWFGTAVTYAPQHFFGVPLPVMLLWAAFKKDKQLVTLNLLAFAFFGSLLLGYCVPWRAALDNLRMSDDQEIRLRVMTYNIHHSRAGGAIVADEIYKADPDIVCLQEANPILGWSSAVSEIRNSSGKWNMVDYGELAIFSKYPFKSHQIGQMENVTGRVYLKAVLDVDGREVTVINVHLNSSLRPHMDLKEATISERLDNASEIRSVQVKAVLEAARDSGTPLILAGDFNTPPRGPVYHQITNGLSDAFRTAGWGLGYTFRSDMPVMRIDHILLGGGVRATRCSVPLTAASDHLPVVADIAIPR